MKLVLSCLLACASILVSGEAPTPAAPSPASQKLVDDAAAVVAKARVAYDQATRKEQEKLLAALTKEQERETKKGSLDGAMAVKALIEEVQAGLLTRKAEESADLLGEGGGKVPAPGTVPANLATDCPIAPGTADADGAPHAIEAMMTKASVLALAKGDKTRYTFTVAAPGTVAILTGSNERNHADIWSELLKAGFKRAEDGERGAWFILEARAGAKFSAFDPPLAGAQLQIFAGKIKQVR